MNENNYKQEDLFSSSFTGKQNKQTKKLLFSYSKMSMYCECPLKYKFKYEDKLPEKPKYFFAFGQTMHEILEIFHKSVPPPSLEELLDKFSILWNKKNYEEKGYPNKEKHDNDFYKGKNIIEKYYLKHRNDKELPFLLEYKTEVEIDGLNVIIVADKIEYLGKGLIKIVDYKTGKPADRTPEQLYMYQKICESDPMLLNRIKERKGENPDIVRVDSLLYYYLEGLNEKNYKRAQEDEIKNFWDKVLKTADNILSSRFEPLPSEKACAFCDFKEFCPVFSEKSYPKKEFKKDNNELNSLLDDYANAVSQWESLRSKIESLENKIAEKMSGESLEWENDSFFISLKKEIGYEPKDRDDLISALKNCGLYEKVLWPMKAKIEELILSGELDEKQEKEIKKHLLEKRRLKRLKFGVK
ncbi:MAG: PD-(D/E)XK nuclease family protein [Elusimicrobia bacterium]|nr:PD-(D/E)XK nuclease family protein [Elusimicrobiota bacterium]